MKSSDTPFERYARAGLWGLVIWALGLLVGTWNHQPPPQTDLADWSRFVTTTDFLISHLVASIVATGFGVLGMAALAALLVSRGSVRLGLWALVTGVMAATLLVSVFGIAAYAQPAIGRLYLAGNHAVAQSLYYDAAQGTPMVAMAAVGIVLLVTSMILFGVAIGRCTWLPRLAGVGLAVSAPVIFLVGFVFDNWIQSVGSALLVGSTLWIAIAVRREAQSGRLTTGESKDVPVTTGG